MKKRRHHVDKAAPATAPARPAGRVPRRWPYALGAAAALVILLEVYQPALRGAFVFDDQYLPFTDPKAVTEPLWMWLRGVRPLLMASFWVNYRLAEMEPYLYHLFNLLLHWANGLLVWVVADRLLQARDVAGWRRPLLATFAAGVFLLHPVQTESVAYVASRSEVLSVMFFLGALALFVRRRREAVSWWVAAGVLLLFGAAVSTKEHTAILPALLLLTDYYFNPGFSAQGIRRNWRLYAPIAVGGALAALWVWRLLSRADTAGFAVAEFTWYEYFLTQCRVIWIYLRLFLLPYGQTLDYDLAMSRTVLEPLVIAGLAGLLALAGAAFYFRRRYPLASYGVLVFLLLLAPTSSVVPILDPIAEHRLYLPMLGLALAAADLLHRLRVRPARLAAILAVLLVVAGALARERNRVWSSDIALWEDAVAKSPRKYRAHFQLGFAYFRAGRCEDAERHYRIAAGLPTPDFRLYYNWGMAYACLGRTAEAREQFLATIKDCQRHLHQDPGDNATREILHLAEERLGLAR